MATLNDMTVGKPSKLILNFSMPLLLSTALQQLYNIADSVIVGQFTGSAGLAAIGAAYPITLFYIAVATGASMGCSVIISQLFGAKRMRDMKSAIFTAIFTLLGLGSVFAGAGVLLSGPLMQLLGCPESTFADAKAYLAIYSVGVLPMFLYNSANGIYTGLGDSKRPLYFLLLSSVLNVILDIIAVGPMGLGVIGAAWATTISQAVAAVLANVLLVVRIRSVESEPGVKLFDTTLLGQMTKIAVPTIFQQSCVALSHTILQSLVNSFGTAVMAGYEAASKLHNFAYMCFNTIGTALSSFVAQNYGAGKRTRIKEGFKISTAMCFICTVVVVVIFQLFPRQLVGLFVDAGTEAAVIDVGENYLRIISPMYLIICLIITTGGLLRGLGKSMTFFLETVTEFIVRVVMCFVLTKVLASYTGLMWAWYFGSPVGFCLCLSLAIRQFRTVLSEPDTL